MRQVIFTGGADVRLLEEADFVKLGVERKHSLEFQRGVAHEVSDEVAHALLTHHLIVGQFIELEASDEEEETELVKDPEDHPQGSGGEGAPELSANIVDDSGLTDGATSTVLEDDAKPSGKRRRGNHEDDDS